MPRVGRLPPRGDFQEPITFHAVHIRVPLKALADPVAERAAAKKWKFGWPLSTADDVLSSAVALNCPWQSTAPQAGPEERPDRIDKVAFLEGSFLHRAFQRLPLGELWPRADSWRPTAPLPAHVSFHNFDPFEPP